MHISKVILFFKLQLLGTASLVAGSTQFNKICDAADNGATGPNIEVYYLMSSHLEFSCDCMRCSWFKFGNYSPPQPVGNGSRLNWTETESGYGQFNCIRFNNTVAKKLLILPNGKK